MNKKNLTLIQNYKKFKYSLILVIAAVILFSDCWHNTLHVADEGFFKNFQLDSEELVLGKIYMDNKKESTGNSNLGRPLIPNENSVSRLGYLLTSLDDEMYQVEVSDYTDQNWKSGINLRGSVLLVSQKYFNKLILCVDCPILIGDEKRTITKVYLQGGFTNIEFSGDKIFPDINIKSLTIDFGNTLKSVSYQVYQSQYGLQGIVSSYFFNCWNLSISSIQKLNLICFVIAVLVITVLIKHLFEVKLAVIFFLSMACSPWVISFARNLYWVEFTWFLPAIFAWAAYQTKYGYRKKIYIFGFVISVFVKSLCGYEYLSTILLFASAPALYNLFMSSDRDDAFRNLSFIFILFICGLSGFFFAVIMHIKLVFGDDIFDGIKAIWKYEVMRRTYGDPNLFDNEFRASLMASPVFVIKNYLLNWNTDILCFSKVFTISFNKQALILLSGVSLVLTFVEMKINKNRGRSYFALLIAFILPAVSWFILAKGHSYVHTHMNYVLWYFGYVAILLYIPCDFLVERVSLQRKSGSY